MFHGIFGTTVACTETNTDDGEEVGIEGDCRHLMVKLLEITSLNKKLINVPKIFWEIKCFSVETQLL